jgi:hypothetical protein
MRSAEDVQNYVDPKIPEGVTFNCEEIKQLRTRHNKRSQYLSCVFKWQTREKDGHPLNYGRRINVMNVKAEVDRMIEVVKSLNAGS